MEKPNNLKLIVVMPAYNAERTLEKVYNEIPHNIVKDIILVDDMSKDTTIEIAKKLGIRTILHPKNLGYGANQKTCYREALKTDANIIVMLHPDYQYDPKLIPEIIRPIQSGAADVVFGSRLLDGKALRSGMPVYKYVSNKILTLVENLAFKTKYSEFHTGYRAYKREVLEDIPFMSFSDDFVFDTQMVVYIMKLRFNLSEIPVAAKYDKDSSTISFTRSVIYGLKSLIALGKYVFL